MGGSQHLRDPRQFRQALGRMVGAGDQRRHPPMGFARHAPGRFDVAGGQSPHCLEPQAMGQVDHGTGIAGVLGRQRPQAGDQRVERLGVFLRPVGVGHEPKPGEPGPVGAA